MILHREAEKGTIFLLCTSFEYLTETGEVFTYTRPKESRSVSYNSVCFGMRWEFCSDSDIKHYVYQSSNEIDDYRLVFIVSISLLRKIFNASQN